MAQRFAGTQRSRLRRSHSGSQLAGRLFQKAAVRVFGSLQGGEHGFDFAAQFVIRAAGLR
ncbi:MAG: hypothetical protein HY011_01680 [Acidobacteria bacterium]|nr:hypothetical protein [Acidobacteriota bacterium]